MNTFEQWYVDTYYTAHGLVPPKDLFRQYEGTYLDEDVYRQNLAWQARQPEINRLELWYKNVKLQFENKELDSAIDAKKINELQKRVDELELAFKQLIEMENQSISFERDLFDKGWNQAARTTVENIYKLTGLNEQKLEGSEK